MPDSVRMLLVRVPYASGAGPGRYPHTIDRTQADLIGEEHEADKININQLI